MSNVVPLRGAENAGDRWPLCSPPQPTLRASLTGAVGRCWRKVRGTVEAFGWIVLVVSIIVAIR